MGDVRLQTGVSAYGGIKMQSFSREIVGSVVWCSLYAYGRCPFTDRGVRLWGVKMQSFSREVVGSVVWCSLYAYGRCPFTDRGVRLWGVKMQILSREIVGGPQFAVHLRRKGGGRGGA